MTFACNFYLPDFLYQNFLVILAKPPSLISYQIMLNISKISAILRTIPFYNAHKAAQLAIVNWRNHTTDMANRNKKADIDLTNRELAKFNINIETFLANDIHKTCCKWVMDHFKKYSNNNIITLLIIYIRVKSAIYIKEFFIICYCLINKLHHFDISDIDYINEDIISL